MRRLAIAIAGLAALSTPAAIVALDDDPFAAHVRPTEPLSPADALRAFRLPPGFEMRLVAAEPDIFKPMNLAFDARGRIWVTDTIEYPFAAPADRAGRDTLKVLEDTDGDGRADRITTFADGLNIPIGVLPYLDGAIVFSIPNIWRLRDRDGDGRADEREVLYGPMGVERDTHGLNNSFRRGFDGWIYACHGFNNQTAVRGRDGGEVRMNSGNTYRFRPDGSRIEQYTWGQVNPFGMAFDALGYAYTADCHSSPIYQLLRGGYYPSFGKPHDGLGFVPPVMTHGHGSTAIAGLARYEAADFPEEFRGNIFVGNVMTSRVNRDVVERHGSTIRAREAEDLVRTQDPWFRPVDLRVGPDGALYIADFYNRIIGHYEVPLTHPGRDRHSGRIWRLSWRGAAVAAEDSRSPDLAAAGLEALIGALENANLTVRLLATHEIVDRFGKGAKEPLLAAMRDPARGASVRAHGAWALERAGALDGDVIDGLARDPSELVRAHVQRVLAERADWTARERRLAADGLRDASADVSRLAAEAIGLHPHVDQVGAILSVMGGIPAGDAYRLQACRIALRNQLGAPGALAGLADRELDAAALAELAAMALAVPGEEAAIFLLAHLERGGGIRGGAAARVEALRRIARFAPADGVERVIAVARDGVADDADVALEIIGAIKAGLDQRGGGASPALESWAGEVAAALIDAAGKAGAGWTALPLPGLAAGPAPWAFEPRRSADRDRARPFLSSLPRGESLTGVLRSSEFDIPAWLRFFLAGHIGYPDRPVVAKSFVRLRLASTDELVAEALPPRNDVAQPVQWDLAAWQGKRGYLEIIDGDDGDAYAWLAVARFDPDVAPLPAAEPARVADRLEGACRLAEELALSSARPRLEALVRAKSAAARVRAAAARALLSIAPDAALAQLLPAVGNEAIPAALRDRACDAIADRDAARAREVQLEAVTAASGRAQEEIAAALAGSRDGAAAIIDLIAAGKASARMLVRGPVRDRVLGSGLDGIGERVEALTASLPPEDEARRALMDERLRLFARSSPSTERGREVFGKTCAPCHRIGESGAVIGPQLDGLGSRGLERIVEDILDPDRNVDIAFRRATLILDDGVVQSGLIRREEGETLVLADVEGKETAIPRRRIARILPSESSLMPDNVAETLSPEALNDLVAYLLAQRAAP